MAIKQETLLRLKEDFKLNIYEVRIWTVLLEKGIATAGELADLSSVPRSRCYDVLESLEKKGFVLMKIGKPIKYLSVPPEEIMERVRKNIEADTDMSLKMLEEVRGTDIFKDLELLYNTGIEKFESTDMCNALIGRENLNYFIKGMFEKARKEIFIMTSEEGFQRKLNLLSKVIKKGNKRGLKVTIVAPVKPAAYAKVKDSMKIITQDTEARIVIVDQTESLFMMSDGKASKEKDCGIWVKSEFFTKGLLSMVQPQA
ncbi:TrmB family transcriptional regulator [Candidatus Woesearchaeota archaeon]|nr:TrmB family transcriptional regulator [Candidatus Woesearchaeota archaeon]